MILRSTLLVVLLCCSYSELKSECTSETLGLCTPGITSENSGSEVIDTIVTHQDSGDILDGSNGYVTSTKEGDMDSDWGGQGPASMPSGNSCYGLGTDKCAMITGSGNTTSNMGVEGMGTTFKQTINISDLSIDRGGQVKYNIEVDKQDSEDRVYMHITGLNNSNSVFSGTDILSETGATTGYQQYSGSFDFSGSLNIITVEIGGRDINLSVGPLFDDVSINVLYNTVVTIVNQQIQNIEEFLTLDYDQDINNVAEMIFESNEITEDFTFQPIEAPVEEFSFESVEMEMQEFEMDFQMDMDMNMEYDMPDIVMVSTDTDMEMPMEITVDSVEIDIEMEIDIETTTEEPTMDMPETMEEEPVMKTNTDSESEQIEEQQQEPEQEVEEEPKEEIKPEPSAKQKAATKIVKQMGDRGKYDSSNQLKTLVIMQVLGNTKSFFSPNTIPDIEGFFLDTTLPDNILSDNNMAQYYMTINDNTVFNTIANSQYQ